jgi:hypothetical protein
MITKSKLINPEGEFVDNYFYFSIHIRDELVKHGWCVRVSHLLTSIDPNNFDQIEKILMSMIPLTDVCRNDFVSLLPILDELNDIYTKLNHNDGSSYTEMLNNIQNLRLNLRQSLGSDL